MVGDCDKRLRHAGGQFEEGSYPRCWRPLVLQGVQLRNLLQTHALITIRGLRHLLDGDARWALRQASRGRRLGANLVQRLLVCCVGLRRQDDVACVKIADLDVMLQSHLVNRLALASLDAERLTCSALNRKPTRAQNTTIIRVRAFREAKCNGHITRHTRKPGTLCPGSTQKSIADPGSASQ